MFIIIWVLFDWNIIGDIIFYDSNMHCVTIFKRAIDFFYNINKKKYNKNTFKLNYNEKSGA